MADEVVTTSHVVQWRVANLQPYTKIKSHPFKMGYWNWYLVVESNEQLYVKLYPEVSSPTMDRAPIASFIIKVFSYPYPNSSTFVHPEIHDKQLTKSDDFVWAIDTVLSGRFTIDVEFLDLKKASSGREPLSIWDGCHAEHHHAAICSAGTSVRRMFTEGIHTDITINVGDESIRAHRAVLASRSPVFRGMFSHNLKEEEESTVNISDMSSEECRAFLSYIYGDFRSAQFGTHRLALLRAADKYDIPDLMEACQKSLMEDIDTKNVIERLQTAHLHRSPKLKKSCVRYLLDFGRILQLHADDYAAFHHDADRELISEIFLDVLSRWTIS